MDVCVYLRTTLLFLLYIYDLHMENEGEEKGDALYSLKQWTVAAELAAFFDSRNIPN